MKDDENGQAHLGIFQGQKKVGNDQDHHKGKLDELAGISTDEKKVQEEQIGQQPDLDIGEAPDVPSEETQVGVRQKTQELRRSGHGKTIILHPAMDRG